MQDLAPADFHDPLMAVLQDGPFYCPGASVAALLDFVENVRHDLSKNTRTYTTKDLEQ